MPIEYERDERPRLITVTVTEPYSVDDILNAIDRQAAEATLEYAMLYDLRGVKEVSTETDLQQMADRAKLARGGREQGQVGIAITARPAHFLVFLTYAQLTREFATVEVLLTVAQLDAWLARHARGGSGKPM
jgi:hypothetical protein